jgi:hypothetical protein
VDPRRAADRRDRAAAHRGGNTRQPRRAVHPHRDPPNFALPDVNTLCGLAVWSAVLVVTLSLVADAATVLLDPRVEARAR